MLLMILTAWIKFFSRGICGVNRIITLEKNRWWFLNGIPDDCIWVRAKFLGKKHQTNTLCFCRSLVPINIFQRETQNQHNKRCILFVIVLLEKSLKVIDHLRSVQYEASQLIVSIGGSILYGGCYYQVRVIFMFSECPFYCSKLWPSLYLQHVWTERKFNIDRLGFQQITPHTHSHEPQMHCNFVWCVCL